MPSEECEYEPTSPWCADLLLRGNQLIGVGGCEWLSEQQQQAVEFNNLLCSMAIGDVVPLANYRSSIFAMSLLRREVAR
jgi:hypothetical protein